MSNQEAIQLFPKLIDFITRYNIQPNIKSIDPFERKLAEAKKIIKQIIK